MKRQKIEATINFWVLLILIVFLLAVLFYNVKLREENKVIEQGKALASYWACDDGCFYAICKEVTYTLNESCSQEEFNKCANRCFYRYMAEDKFLLKLIQDMPIEEYREYD